MSHAPALCMWDFLGGGVRIIFDLSSLGMCVCARACPWEGKRGSISAWLPAKQLQMSRDVLSLFSHQGAWIASLSDLSHSLRLLHANTFLCDAHKHLHDCRHTHTRRHTVADRHTLPGQILTLISVDSTHILQETQAIQRFTHTRDSTHIHKYRRRELCSWDLSAGPHWRCD